MWVCVCVLRIFRQHHRYAVPRCDQSLLMSHVASVCVTVCVGYTGELCRNGWTDRDAVWGAESCGYKEPLLDGVQMPYGKRHFWGDMCPPIVTCLCMSALRIVRLLPWANVPAQSTRYGDAAFCHIMSDTCFSCSNIRNIQTGPYSPNT